MHFTQPTSAFLSAEIFFPRGDDARFKMRSLRELFSELLEEDERTLRSSGNSSSMILLLSEVTSLCSKGSLDAELERRLDVDKRPPNISIFWAVSAKGRFLICGFELD